MMPTERHSQPPKRAGEPAAIAATTHTTLSEAQRQEIIQLASRHPYAVEWFPDGLDDDVIVKYLDDYLTTLATKGLDPITRRTPYETAVFLLGQIAYDDGQSDAGM